MRREDEQPDFAAIFSRLTTGRPSSVVEVDPVELRRLRLDSQLLAVARDLIHDITGITLESHLEILDAAAADDAEHSGPPRARRRPRKSRPGPSE
jgi:hypothetical protein